MNERIKEFYNKAWLKVDPSNPQETFTNAFAELIVKECGRHLMSQEFIGRRDLDWSLVLKEHFGIK
jgi:hypothetical protein